MPKTETSEPVASPTPTVDDKSRAIARQVVQDITGCGQVEAEERLKSIDIQKLLAFEKAGQRAKIVCMLY